MSPTINAPAATLELCHISANRNAKNSGGAYEEQGKESQRQDRRPTHQDEKRNRVR